MKLSDKTFQAISTYGGTILIICAFANIYLVMRYTEVNRAGVRNGQQYQKLAVQQQVLERILQEFATHGNNDPQIMDILLRHGVVRDTPLPSQQGNQ